MENKELWNKLEYFEIGESNSTLTFAKRLARENNWSEYFAERCLAEYKKFVYLCANGNTACTPSDQIDQVWHLHLTYTRSYWQDMCSELLGFALHHNPTEGGAEQSELFKQQYQQTLDRYQQEFGEKPPADIWPSVEQRFQHADQFRRINQAQYWLLPKPGRTAIAIPSLSLLLAACTSTITSDPLTILLFCCIAFVSLLIGLIWWSNRKKSDKAKGNGCGGGCGGGDGNPNGNGDSGCGSGCGGCGG